MVWTIKYSEVVVKQLKKLDKAVAKRIMQFMSHKVAAQDDPTVFGKALLHDKSGLWRYRIDNYRVVCHLEKQELVILMLRIGHRKEVYR